MLPCLILPCVLQRVLPSARTWRRQTRSLSNLRLAKGSISSLYQVRALVLEGACVCAYAGQLT